MKLSFIMGGSELTMRVVTLIFLSLIVSAYSRTVHEEIPPEEWAKLYPGVGTEVPEYDIVPIHTLRIQKRDVDGKTHIQIKAFGKQIKLWLNPIDGILASTNTPVFTILHGFDIVERRHELEDVISNLYEDLSQVSTLSINETPDGKTELNGILGSHNMYIRPVPNDYLNYARRYKRSADNNTVESDFGNYTYHIVFKLPQEPEHLKNFETSIQTSLRSKRSTPDILYPEILVIMDYPLFKILEKNRQASLAYLLAFWNGVDMKYRSLENPKFRLNIAGIIIALEPDSLEYMSYRTHYEPHYTIVQDAIDASRAWLVDLEYHLPHFDFDAAVTMTSETFCTMNNDKCTTGVVGIAFRGGFCSTAERVKYNDYYVYETVKSAIVHDEAGFRGIITTAHELAHLLGAVHDGQENNTCNATYGHIMSAIAVRSSNSSDWSPCSAQAFEEFLNKEPTCLYNKPKSGYILPRYLPGKLENADMQCKKLEGTFAAIVDDTTCVKLQCISRYDRFDILRYPPAADGTPCGRGKLCLHSRCIKESEITY